MKRFMSTPTKSILTTWFLLLCAAAFSACGTSDDGGGSSNKNTELGDLVGTYEVTGFSVTFEGRTVTDEDVQSWSGEVIIAPESTISMTLTRSEDLFDFGTATILELRDDSFYMDAGDCRQWIDMNRDGDIITLIGDEGDCMKDGSMVIEMRKTGSTVKSLNGKGVASRSCEGFFPKKEQMENLIDFLTTS